MKAIIVTSVVLLTGIAGNAIADCSLFPTKVTGAALVNLMSTGVQGTTGGGTSSLVCGRPADAYPFGGLGSPDRWQEEHLGGAGATGGELWDYKLGPTDKIDPRAKVGGWVILGRGIDQVVHSYSGGLSYTWDVRPISGTVYAFCKAGTMEEHVRAYITPNPGTGCGGSYPP